LGGGPPGVAEAGVPAAEAAGVGLGALAEGETVPIAEEALLGEAAGAEALVEAAAVGAGVAVGAVTAGAVAEAEAAAGAEVVGAALPPAGGKAGVVFAMALLVSLSKRPTRRSIPWRAVRMVRSRVIPKKAIPK
jgi:hypothetical protein